MVLEFCCYCSAVVGLNTQWKASTDQRWLITHFASVYVWAALHTLLLDFTSQKLLHIKHFQIITKSPYTEPQPHSPFQDSVPPNLCLSKSWNMTLGLSVCTVLGSSTSWLFVSVQCSRKSKSKNAPAKLLSAPLRRHGHGLIWLFWKRMLQMPWQNTSYFQFACTAFIKNRPSSPSSEGSQRDDCSFNLKRQSRSVVLS